jgi:hypothetical protein
VIEHVAGKSFLFGNLNMVGMLPAASTPSSIIRFQEAKQLRLRQNQLHNYQLTVLKKQLLF